MGRGIVEGCRTQHERVAEVIRVSSIWENEYLPRGDGRASQVRGKVEAGKSGHPRAAG